MIPRSYEEVVANKPATSMLPHHKRSLGYDHRILPFVIVKAWECNEHVNDCEEDRMANHSGSYGSSLHGPT
jgi:hypothetical protein